MTLPWGDRRLNGSEGVTDFLLCDGIMLENVYKWVIHCLPPQFVYVCYAIGCMRCIPLTSNLLRLRLQWADQQTWRSADLQHYELRWPTHCNRIQSKSSSQMSPALENNDGRVLVRRSRDEQSRSSSPKVIPDECLVLWSGELWITRVHLLQISGTLNS